MDDSREIILITNGSSLDEQKGDITLPLNESEMKVDSIKETDDKNRQIQKFLSEINEIKSLFTNSLKEKAMVFTS
jgi:hypothetical protein